VAAGGDGEVSCGATVNAMPSPPHSPADPQPPAGDQTVCDSCGAPADDVARVHRVYITPGGWDLAGDDAANDLIDVVHVVVVWCFPCRSQYPHQPLDD
jgi:hypothetical protein